MMTIYENSRQTHVRSGAGRALWCLLHAGGVLPCLTWFISFRLKDLLAKYEGVELSEMLVSMAQSKETDMDILMTLVPEVERRYNEAAVPLFRGCFFLFSNYFKSVCLVRRVLDVSRFPFNGLMPYASSNANPDPTEQN